ncbi:hypothetical protein BEWA_013170 [Theileria equi strain WA]|uniref:Uncharacterized protein n=1 Tax=Theileria equi strain WA TaxID=1537102 RepID=L1LC90_THEEQ|nr:hypothetical protein BEWA_013170 [Theileria equi strain WA]EKX72758.1 hypothetical protein BEWA_013170 [Theileria equi strain WA]|eukprot:XP_004832210.1 hypothetical protein BEWA_013170 [Theileria equi strain WA]
MVTEACGFWAHSAAVDIGNDTINDKDGVTMGEDGKFRYKDECNDVVTIEQAVQNNGYKAYIHRVQKATVTKIKHHSIDQKGFESIENRSYKDVIVYYLGYDYGNLFPLLVGLKRRLSGHYYYYKKSSYDMSSVEWKEAGSNVIQELSYISKVIKDLILLKLDAINGESYGVDGTSNSAINTDVKITVSVQNNYKPGYDQYTHAIVGSGPMRILGTKHKDTYKPFKDSALGTTYESASIYYSSLDNHLSEPLILQLGDSILYRLDGEKWVKDAQMTFDTLEKNLKLLSCAHIIDISKSIPYKCTSSYCKREIQVDRVLDKSHNFTLYKHHLMDSEPFSISSFVSDVAHQVGLPPVWNIKCICVYQYSQTGEPILICFSSGTHQWYRKSGENEWSMEDGLVGHSDPKDISNRLKEIYNGLNEVVEPESGASERIEENTPKAESQDDEMPTVDEKPYQRPNTGAHIPTASVVMGIVGMCVGTAIVVDIYNYHHHPHLSLISRTLRIT